MVGARARSYKDSLFTHRYGYAGKYDQGGKLQPGWSAVYNGTSKPEAVLTGGQFNALAGTGDRIGAAVVAGMAQMGPPWSRPPSVSAAPPLRPASSPSPPAARRRPALA
ncbi:hypothetical protein D3C59_34905 [Streptomyces sp. SHP22-7]|nr:hypothetical protein D3C59_34905 [Streptomyces sp. SHP22-7]